MAIPASAMRVNCLLRWNSARMRNQHIWRTKKRTSGCRSEATHPRVLRNSAVDNPKAIREIRGMTRTSTDITDKAIRSGP
eukprot:5302204-Pleurochrysis_carterae.AAC.1